jgi:hypothetical protein
MRKLAVRWLVKITQNPLGCGRDLPATNDHFPFICGQSFRRGTGLSEIFLREFLVEAQGDFGRNAQEASTAIIVGDLHSNMSLSDLPSRAFPVSPIAGNIRGSRPGTGVSSVAL